MRGLMRFLMMFGPMIFRQYQRYQQKKEREQYNQRRLPQDNRQYQQPQENRGRNSRSRQTDYNQEPPRDGRYYKGNNDQYQRQQKPTPPPPPTPKKPELTEDEKNFNLKEEEFMLDPSTQAEYKNEMDAIEQNSKMSHEELTNDQLSLHNQAENKSTNPIERADEDDDGFNIRDLFLKPEDDEESKA